MFIRKSRVVKFSFSAHQTILTDPHLIKMLFGLRRLVSRRLRPAKVRARPSGSGPQGQALRVRPSGSGPQGQALRVRPSGSMVPKMSYIQSVRWSKRPASQCVRRLVKASDVIGQSVRCGWSKRPMWLVNASGTNDVVIRLSDLINYMN